MHVSIYVEMLMLTHHLLSHVGSVYSVNTGQLVFEQDVSTCYCVCNYTECGMNKVCNYTGNNSLKRLKLK